ncbi:MAG: PAS domain-containing protein [Candidatus Pacebacteria bacterium]|nr:PAS domain-containing protein [Candidatus Paceibacterota bacterium]
MTFVSPSPVSWAAVAFMFSKLLTFSHPLMLIFYGTTHSYWSNLAAYLAPMTYFDSDTSFYTFAYVFFVLLQLPVALLGFKLYALWGQLRKNACPAEYSPTCQALHVFFLLSAKVLIHVSLSALFYSAANLLGSGTFDDYKHLSVWPNVDAQTYAVFALMFVASLETIVAGVSFLVFCQDRSVRKASFWSAPTWYHATAEIGFAVVVEAEFFFGSSAELGYIIRCLARAATLLLLSLYTKYAHYWVDVAEFFFATLETELNAFVLILLAMNWSFDQYSSYTVILIPFSLLLCVVRAHVTWQSRLEPPRNEETAMDSVCRLLELASNKSQKSFSTLTGLLVMHSNTCQTEGCQCRALILQLITPGAAEGGQQSLAGDAAMTESTAVYLSESSLPSGINKGPVKEVLTILVGDVATHIQKGEELDTQMAELDFYYLRNHYMALKRIAQVEAGKPRLTVRQRVYNLGRSIAMGFERWTEEDDPEKTLLALDYLKHYHKFLDQIEDSIDSTVKFWSIVLEEAPSSEKLSELGKVLFDCKYKTTKTVEKLTHLASNNIEFLVRYGLFMRLVMHDLITSEQVFQKIISLNAALESSLVSKFAESAFSIFRFDASVMLIAARMEHTGAGIITEMNTSVEEALGYTRKDLIGCSVLNIMPPAIAQRHEEYVSKFFHTMKSHNLNVGRMRYVKTKEGLYLLCRCLMKLVPRLDEGLQVSLFLISDRRCLCYTTFKRDFTERKAGAVLCMPGTYSLVGFTREALGILRVSEERVRELMGTISLFDLFPWMERRELMERLFANEGKIVEYHSSHVLSLNKDTGRSMDESVPQEGDRTLLWARFVVEKAEASDVLISLVVSEVPKEQQKNYIPEEDTPIFYTDKRLKGSAFQALAELRRQVQSHLPEKSADKGNGRTPRAEHEYNISDVASVCSMGTSTTSSLRKSDGGLEITRELQIASISRQTPTTIKWLGFGMFGMLVVVAVLIFVNAYVSLTELVGLENRFTLIKEYHYRYKTTMLVTDMARLSCSYLITGSLTKIGQYADIRNTALNDANVVTRRLLFNERLTYDDELLTTVDDNYKPMTVSFSHAILILINAVVDYTSVKSTTTLSVCRNPKKSDVCKSFVSLSSYAYTVGYASLRETQDSVSRRLEAELTTMSRQGETTQYTITGICLGLITLSAGVILPIFVWVIRDKSYVIAIFAEITHDEANQIIEDTRKLDIKNLRYKKRWIVASGDNHEIFWKKLVAEHRKGFGINFRGLEHERESRVKDTVGDAKPCKLGPKESAALSSNDVRPDKNKAEVEELGEEEAEQIAQQKERERIKQEIEDTAKKIRRRERLSEIDYALRRRFVVRLFVVVLIFFMYSGFSFYFNYYVHTNNSNDSDMLFAICKRNIYLHTLNFVLVEAMSQNNVALAGSNPNDDGDMYATDIANEMLKIEAKCKDFEKSASSTWFGEYINLVNLFESPRFCNASDAYSDIVSLVGTCESVYKGPDQYGLSVGISYYIDLHINAAQVFASTNFSNSASVTRFNTANDSVSHIGFTLTYPLSFALGATMDTFYACTMNFFDMVKKVVYGTSIGFVCVFIIIYVLIFTRFIGMLSEEIWHTRGMLNMIPKEIVEKNLDVREQVWKRKGLT